jgi:hypothetical protein
VSVEDSVGHLTITAVYLPPKHTVCKAQLEDFYNTLGPRFIAGGDYNAKHTDWGSRLITPRGREVLKTLESNKLSHLSTGHPTYWPSDVHKIPDLVDICVTKAIPPDFAVAHSCLDLSSNHSPVLVTLTSQAIRHDPPPESQQQTYELGLLQTPHQPMTTSANSSQDNRRHRSGGQALHRYGSMGWLEGDNSTPC